MTTDGMHYSVQQITPKDAERMLGKNLHNRHVIQKKVREYAEAIRRGDWLLTGDPIRFDTEGYLLDGQHRLLAVIEAGKGIQTMVITNLPRTAQDAVDTGVKRTLAHVLQIRGYTSAVQLAAATRALYAYRTAKVFDMRGLDEAGHQQLLNLLQRNNGLQESVRLVANLFSDSGITWLAGMATMHYVITEKHDSDTADTFFTFLTDHGYGGSKKDPIIQLRRRLLEAQRKNTTHRMTPRMKMALTVKAFNAWMLGQEPSDLRWRAGGPNPEDFPELVTQEDVH